MTAYQEKRKAYRDGVVFQGFAAPALFEPVKPNNPFGYTALAPQDPKAFEATAKMMTTPNVGGRLSGKDVLRIREIVGK